MKRRLLVLCVLFIVLLITQYGCIESARYSPDEIKDFPPEMQEHIKQREIVTGMTMQQVRYSWSAPAAIRVIKPSEDGKYREEWIYKRMGVFRTRLIFTDGKLTEIVTNEPGSIK